MKQKGGIYLIKNKFNGKEYYGQGIRVEKRMNESHRSCDAIDRAIKKYGKENFDRKIVLYCEEWELERYEMTCIKVFHSHISEGGYNISLGGDAPMRGRKHRPESIELMCKINAGENNPRYGVPVSKESRDKMSKSRTGEKNGMFGRSGESAPAYGRIHSDEWKRNMSEKLSGKNNPIFGRKSSNSSSPYFGVMRLKGKMEEILKKCWFAGIKQGGKMKKIGSFYEELDAARAYDKYIIEHNLPNPLNFPNEK